MKQDAYFSKDDPTTLFQTQAWRQAWIESWADKLSRDPAIFVGKEALTYSVKRKIKKVLPVTSSIPFGQGCTELKSIRSEYFQPISENESVEEALLSLLKQTKSELTLKDVPLASPWLGLLYELSKRQNLWLFQREKAIGYSVNTHEASFDSYIGSLGSNTRLKLYNRRKRLQEKHSVRLENMWPDVDGFIGLLNKLHRVRWQKPCYQGENLAFIKALLPKLYDQGHGVNLSVLKANDQPVSLLLDITIGHRIYNLQGGFIEDFMKGVSLGTLHFGYAIEQAFLSTDIHAYDFMAGEGKNSNYKVKLANQQCEMANFTLVRNPVLALLYKLKESQ